MCHLVVRALVCGLATLILSGIFPALQLYDSQLLDMDIQSAAVENPQYRQTIPGKDPYFWVTLTTSVISPSTEKLGSFKQYRTLLSNKSRGYSGQTQECGLNSWKIPKAVGVSSFIQVITKHLFLSFPHHPHPLILPFELAAKGRVDILLYMYPFQGVLPFMHRRDSQNPLILHTVQ